MSLITKPYYKQPFEKKPLIMNFVNKIEQADDVVESCTILAYSIPTNQDITSTVIEAVASPISGTRVKTLVKGGSHGDKFKVTFRAITREGLQLEADVVVQVREE